MTIEVHWGDESKQYVLATYCGPWTWDDHRSSFALCCNLIRSVDHPVDVLSDVRLHPDPPGPDAIRHIKWAWDTKPPNLARFIILGADANIFMKNLIRIFANTVGGRDSVRFVNTMEAALAAVKDR